MTYNLIKLTGGTIMQGKRGNGAGIEVMYVIYLIDNLGNEFYIDQQDKLVRIMATDKSNPLLVTSFFQISVLLNSLRDKYPASCRLFALERSEFNERHNQ